MTPTQPSMFDPVEAPTAGLARSDHPDTTYEAAVAIAPRTGTLRRQVLDFIVASGSFGATDLEIQQTLAMNGNTERPRRVELVDGGWVVDSGLRRTANERNMIVWIAAPVLPPPLPTGDANMNLDSIDIDEILPIDSVRRDGMGRYMIVPPDADKPIGYTRVTTLAKVLDEGGGLAPWKAAMTATGMVMRRGLRAQWEALVAEHGDPWYAGREAKNEARRLVEECAAVGGANDRREVGTAMHTITALVDLGHTPDHLSDETLRDIAAYEAGLDRHGVQVLPDQVELCVVLDHFRVAGTFDRLVTMPGFDLPLIADLKTGSDLTYSWQSIAVQLAAYAHGDAIYVQGAAVDGSLDRRLSMPEVDQQWGLVMHLNADAEGEAELKLYHVDLAAGWEAFERSVWTRSWRKQTVAYDAADSRLALPSVGDDEDFGELLELAVTHARRKQLQKRIDAIGADPLLRPVLANTWPTGLPSLRSTEYEHTAADLAVIEQLLDDIEREHWLTPPVDLHREEVARVVDRFPGTQPISYDPTKD